MSKLLVFDNYDSFTYNLVHMIEKLLHQKVDVCKNDEYDIEKFKEYDKIILSPGPGNIFFQSIKFIKIESYWSQ